MLQLQVSPHRPCRCSAQSMPVLAFTFLPRHARRHVPICASQTQSNNSRLDETRKSYKTPGRLLYSVSNSRFVPSQRIYSHALAVRSAPSKDHWWEAFLAVIHHQARGFAQKIGHQDEQALYAPSKRLPTRREYT